MWRSWNIEQWGSRLLDYFFLRHSLGNSTPVETLLVTAEEITAATGDLEAKPDEVRASFIEAVLSAAGDSTVMDHAFEMLWSPEAPEIVPPIMAHLMIACLAAAESTEEFADESSFIRRLESLTHGRFGKLEHMPHHWRRFADWLGAGNNPVRYRRLRLPDPGHLTRIGYTVHLAFPDRRDQQSLSALLAKYKIDQDEPPLAKVMALVAEHRHEFKPRFLQAFDDFRKLADSNDTGFLYRHRFWVAVIAAARRGRAAGATQSTRDLQRQLLAWIADDVATFCVGAAQPMSIPGYKTLPLPVSCGDYLHAIIPEMESELSESAINAGVFAALRGDLRVWTVRACLNGGVLPFGCSASAQLECLIGDDLELAALTLVRSELVETMIRLFGGRKIDSGIEGWSAITECQLRRLPSADLQNGPLAECWLLQATVPRPSLRLIGGIATEDGWLGYARVLPRVRFGIDAQLLIDDGHCKHPLTRVNDHWEFPRKNLSGPHMLSATAGDEVVDMRMMRFHAAPALENYKIPTDPRAWWVEGLGGTNRLSESDGIEHEVIPADASNWTEVRAYLGPNVGEFKPDTAGAMWTALRRSGRTSVARCDPHATLIEPSSQGTDKGANRRWKKILASEPGPDDPGMPTARGSIWKRVNSGLPKVDHAPAPCLVDYEPIVAKPAPSLEEFIPMIAARGCSIAGIPRHDVAELSRLILGVDDAMVPHLIRAWSDAGLIDVTLFARWCSTKIYPRKPMLIGYRDGNSYVVMLTGLSLARTRESLRELAGARGVMTWDKGSFSSFVPTAVCLRAPGVEILEQIAKAIGIPLCWHTLNLAVPKSITPIESGKSEPGGYAIEQPRDRWPGTTALLSGVKVTLKMRSDAPGIWIVKSANGSCWSYSENAIRLAACAMTGAEALTRRGTNELEAIRAYLPTPVARIASLVGQALPGHDGMVYRYSFNTERFRGVIEKAVANSITPMIPTIGE